MTSRPDWAPELVQEVEALAAKPEDLSLMLGT